jgi:hypothetical protein
VRMRWARQPLACNGIRNSINVVARRIRNYVNVIASAAKQSIFLTFFFLSVARWIASLRSQ